MKKQKILIHSIAFSPDGVSTAYLYNDIALGLQQNDYEVVVLTTTPHYNSLAAELKKQPLSKKWGGLFYESVYQGIRVIHVPQKKFKSFPARVAGFIYWHFLSICIGLAQKDISLILSPSPPLTIGLVAIILAKLKGAKTIYNVQEIYPDFLINQGSLRSGFLLGLLRKLERFVYNHSDRVTTIDEVFYNTIVTRFKQPENLIIIPNFVDTQIYRPVSEQGILDKTLFPDTTRLKLMYAGNIGHAQDWKSLLQIASSLRNEPIDFFVIGEGVLKAQLQSDITANHLQNIHLIPYQSRSVMPHIISYADLHFIFMSPQMDGQGFPSKVYTLMACGKPILVLSGKGTPLSNFLQDKNCSFLITESKETEKYQQAVTVLQDVLSDRSILAKLGENGFEIVKETFSEKVVIGKYVKLVKDIVS